VWLDAVLRLFVGKGRQLLRHRIGGDTGPGTYTTSGATFTLTVTKPVVLNTAPTVSVSGVSSGSAYEFGNVPAATCNVVDKEDGNSSFRAA
jgi:hypothetical protein